MRWAALFGALAVVAFVQTGGAAFAAEVVSLDPQPDGTLALVGSGWRPGQQLVISLGSDAFPALADATGSFEVPTGLLVRGGPPLSLTVRRMEAAARPSAQHGSPQEADGPNSFAVMFAQSLAVGVQWFAASAAGLGLATLATRCAVRVRRRGRPSP